MTKLGERSITFLIPLNAFNYILSTSISAKFNSIAGGRT